jgi:hypothetical protein
MPHISRKLLLSYIYSLLSIACGILVGNLLGSVKRVSDADSTLVFVQIWCSLLRRKTTSIATRICTETYAKTSAPS